MLWFVGLLCVCFGLCSSLCWWWLVCLAVGLVVVLHFERCCVCVCFTCCLLLMLVSA